MSAQHLSSPCHCINTHPKKVKRMVQLTDQVVIVTGAGTGIGQTVARDFVQQGAKVALIGRRTEKLQETASSLPEEKVLLCSCDVADRDAVNSTVEQIVQHFGTVDILVNNAGTNSNPRSVAEIDPADWDLVVNVNLTGAFNMARAVLEGMRRKQAGLIINVASTAGVQASKLSGSAYAASKHGMVAFSHILHEEEWENGIRVTAICPGEVDTPILNMRPTPVSAERRAKMLQPDDVSAAVLFVAGLPERANVPVLVIKPNYQMFR
jgi:NADP-dependent 3-hydroxy acid dehydrogenase YdfG